MNRLISVVLVCIGLLLPVVGQGAEIVIINNDGPGEGFNDPTPRAAVGGNTGTTLGEQRLFAFEFAADLLGDKLVSTVSIEVSAEFNPLDCDTNSATLGQAGAQSIVDYEDNPPAGAQANTFYPVALGNALSGTDLVIGETDIGAEFNSDIDDNDDCLSGVNWYYGVDNNPSAGDVDFLSTVVHEIVHGLGFSSFANLTTGAFPGDGTPDIFSRLIRDLTQGTTWDNMTAPQRLASATNDGNVVFDGASTISQGAPTLNTGTNQGFVQLHAPPVIQPGSSISHWSTVLNPNALMEPNDTGDSDFTNGIGLATCALQDIGWVLTSGTNCPSDANDTTNPGGGGTGGGGTGGGGTGGGGTGGGNTGGGGGSSGAMGPALLLLLAGCAAFRRRRQTH